MGQVVGGSLCTRPRLVHVDEWQRPTHHCKTTVFQLEMKIEYSSALRLSSVSGFLLYHNPSSWQLGVCALLER